MFIIVYHVGLVDLSLPSLVLAKKYIFLKSIFSNTSTIHSPAKSATLLGTANPSESLSVEMVGKITLQHFYGTPARNVAILLDLERLSLLLT